MPGRHRNPTNAISVELFDMDQRLAVVERRADRVRELLHAAEIIALGHDDAETLIRLDWRPDHFRQLPGVRGAPGLYTTTGTRR